MGRRPEAAAAWAARMRAAYLSAAFTEAAAIYDEHDQVVAPLELVLMRSRIALARDPALALDLLLAQRKRFEQLSNQLPAQ